jgi:hypothetical protein
MGILPKIQNFSRDPGQTLGTCLRKYDRRYFLAIQSTLEFFLERIPYATARKYGVLDQGRIKPLRMAYLTSPAVSWILSFSMMRARWVSAVFVLMFKKPAASLVVLPSATS